MNIVKTDDCESSSRLFYLYLKHRMFELSTGLMFRIHRVRVFDLSSPRVFYSSADLGVERRAEGAKGGGDYGRERGGEFRGCDYRLLPSKRASGRRGTTPFLEINFPAPHTPSGFYCYFIFLSAKNSYCFTTEVRLYLFPFSTARPRTSLHIR